MRFRIKLFADGARPSDIYELAKNEMISGFTTNPSLMRSAGIQDYEGFAREILSRIKDKPISFEVFADDFPEMTRQAVKLASWGKNVFVKIPITNSKGESTAPVVRELSTKGVPLNITAIFTVQQLQHIHAALSKTTPTILSVFGGRISDAGGDAYEIFRECRAWLDSQKSTAELLWASTREIFNIIQAEEAGAHIITVTPDLLRKVGNIGKDLEAYSLETVQMFKRDAEAAGYTL